MSRFCAFARVVELTDDDRFSAQATQVIGADLCIRLAVKERDVERGGIKLALYADVILFDEEL